MKKFAAMLILLSSVALAQPVLDLQGQRGQLQMQSDSQGRPQVRLRSHRQAPTTNQAEDGRSQVVVDPHRSGVTRITTSRGTIVVPNELVKSLLEADGCGEIRFSQP